MKLWINIYRHRDAPVEYGDLIENEGSELARKLPHYWPITSLYPTKEAADKAREEQDDSYKNRYPRVACVEVEFDEYGRA